MPKDPAQNQPKKGNQNGTPKGAVTNTSTPKKKAKGPKPVVTINAPKPSQIKPVNNTPKTQVKQTNPSSNPKTQVNQTNPPSNQSVKYESAIQTARMIAKNQSHPKNKDVSDKFLCE